MAATLFVFEGSVRNGVWLANVMESASHCIEIARVAFGPQGIFIRAMPASQELMIDVRVKRAAFKSLHVSGAQTFELGLNVVHLAKILKSFRLTGTDGVELRVNHGQTRLSMCVRTEHCCRRFDLRALSLQFMANAPPSDCHRGWGPYPCEIELQTRTLADIVKEVEAVDRECLELSVRRASKGEFMLGNTAFAISPALDEEVDEVRSERRVDNVCSQLSALKCGSKAARKPQRSPIVRVDTVKRILKQKCCDTIKVSHIRIFAIKIGTSALNNAAV